MDPQKFSGQNLTDTNTPSLDDTADNFKPSEEAGQPPDSVITGDQTPPGEVSPAPVNRKKTGLIVGIIAAVLVVFGGAAAAYFAFMAPKSDKVLQAALASTFSKDKVKTVAFEGQASLARQASGTTFTADFSGAASQNGQLTLAAKLRIPDIAPVTVELRSTDGQTVFARLAGLADVVARLESVPAVAPYAPLLASLDNQWYEISPAMLRQLSGSSASTSTPAAELSDSDRQKLADAYNQHQFMAVRQTLADETIGGTNSYHYKVGIDGAKFKAFVSAVEAANIESLGVLSPLFDSLKANTADAELLNNPVDIWIAKDSKLFTQFAYSAENADNTFQIKVTLKDYNKDVTVEQPEGAKPLADLLASFYKALGSQ